MMKKIVLLFALVLCVSMVWGQVISQYIETNSGTTPKGIEIWNNTDSTLDFSTNNLVIEKGANGGTPSTDYTLSTGTLTSGDVIVIGTSDLQTTTESNGSTFYEKGFTFNGNDALVVKYGGTITDVFGIIESDPGSAWSGNGVSTANQNIQLKSGITSGDIDGWTDPSERFETVSTDPSNDQTGFGIAPVGGTIPPSIFNITHTPETVTSSDAVTISAEVTEGDAAISYVELHWGLASGDLTNTISMSTTGKALYISDDPITAQADGVTVYFEIYAEDIDGESSTTSEQSYTVNDPATTTLPYNETFDSNLGDCYTYSVSGDTKEWEYHSSAYAYINGYNSGDLEEDWLILPGIDLDNYSDEVFTFDSWYNYGNDDTDNYLKLMYSTDYMGIGDPSSATWTELTYTAPSASETWTGSGDIDLSAISGTSVWIAFQYHYNSGSYRSWGIDNLSISEATAPEVTVSPSTLSGFSYTEGEGPSGEQTFNVTGTNLTADISISAPTNYEISETSGSGFGSTITLTQSGGNVAETTIYVRLKSGLAVGSYNEDITVSSNDAIDKTVTCTGTVTTAGLVPPSVGVVFISEVSDASTSNSEYLELFNNSDDIIDLTNARLVMLDDGNNYPFTNYTGDTTIPANGLFIIARGATLAEFETEWGTLPENCNFNEGSSAMYFGAGTARRWQLVFDDGTKADVIIDDTQTAVAGSGNRSLQEPIGVWNTDDYSNATPGQLDPGQTLPVVLSEFTAVFAGNTPTIYWTTQSETNNSGWNLYRNQVEDFANAACINVELIEGAGTTSEPTNYSYSDLYPVTAGETYWYWLESVENNGTTETYGPITLDIPAGSDTPELPQLTSLKGNYPNPFNPQTTIEFTVKEGNTGTLTIYNAKGQVLQSVNVDASMQEYTWDAANYGSGVYFYKLETENYSQIKKMIMLK
jgi:hypothetical protein